MEETISLKEIFVVLKKRLNLIILITVIATLVSGIISYFFITPIYQSSTQILVNQSNSEERTFDFNEVRTNLELINTYNVIIKSPTILDKVIAELGLDKSSQQLNGQVTVSNAQNSQVVEIKVEDPDPAMAVKIANTIATVFENEIKEIMNVDNVNVLSEADLGADPSPVSPKPMLNMAIAFVVGLMTGVGLAFLLEYLDNTIKNEHDIDRELGLPILGTIPVIDESKSKSSQKAATSSLRSETLGS
ncbi:YveK family protein [Pseudalkalibacillus caeni]|uniref:Capsular biosynthesis protein n=1 Tax=Exobacillus caeni TaxID=2574798 RepID=A0A5R9F2P0_9BACL|nr:YveK family protein [Pseudalkalibacillus caeni]TLS35173.1 capsular biosynthesis protein [Pseudalkalibacillus caeni]